MFCSNCGKEIGITDKFCPSCGSKVGVNVDSGCNPSPSFNSYSKYPLKDAGIALILSVIIPGLGQIYCGKVGRGISILVASIILAPIIYFFTCAVFVATGSGTAAVIGLLATGLIGFAIWIWNILDARDVAKEYNDYVSQYGNPPW